jgi:Asp-tRNA(Asn)/Glu-tRNA(Gln) amidotransferase A subunit family amidase
MAELENEGTEVEEGSDVDESADVDESKQWYNAATKGKIKGPKMGKTKAGGVKETKAVDEKVEEVKKELAEAVKVIRALKSNINEVNVLNAKLLYVNKLFKAKSLTESQKVKVISAFDKANTIKEAKMIYESLTSTLSTKKKSHIRESFGFASKTVGSPKTKKPEMIVENAAVLRLQQLAGIKPII